MMFYPFAFSRVCGSELATLHARRAELRRAGGQVLAISCDSVHVLRAYAEALAGEALAGEAQLGFRLLSDFWPHGKITRSFGVFDETRGVSERATFFLDVDSSVSYVQQAPAGEARDLDEMLSVLRALGETGQKSTL